MSQGVKRRRPPLSPTSMMHYWKLVFRSCLLLAALVLYIINWVNGSETLFGGVENSPVILLIILFFFVGEMLLRFFPSRLESLGCRKQFAANFHPVPGTEDALPIGIHRGVAAVLLFWIVLNGMIGVLYFAGIIDTGILLLISLVYSVCDMICILFFCPFQTWFLKNKCCTTCRIYNWDYAMMFTPLVFIHSWYCIILVVVSLALVIHWEALVHRHPERFSEATNCALGCAGCREKLCSHKKQLQHFLRKNREHLLRMREQFLRRDRDPR